MNLSELEARGGFVPLAPVSKEVTWKRKDEATGEELSDTFTIHVRRKCFGTMEAVWAIAAVDERSRAAAYMSIVLRLGDEGQDSISYEKAYQLDPDLATAILGAINEVHGIGKVEPKN